MEIEGSRTSEILVAAYISFVGGFNWKKFLIKMRKGILI